MGRIKPKKGAPAAPAEVQAAVDRLVAEELEEGLPRALQDFNWAFEKGDIHHWVPLLNRLDEWFDAAVAGRQDLLLLYGDDDAQRIAREARGGAGRGSPGIAQEGGAAPGRGARGSPWREGRPGRESRGIARRGGAAPGERAGGSPGRGGNRPEKG